MEASTDLITLDDYDLLEDAPVVSAAAEQIAEDTADPEPQTLAEPTATPTTDEAATLPATAATSTITTPSAVVESALPAPAPTATTATTSAAQPTAPAARPDDGKDETLLVVENLLKEMGGRPRVRVRPGRINQQRPDICADPHRSTAEDDDMRSHAMSRTNSTEVGHPSAQTTRG